MKYNYCGVMAGRINIKLLFCMLFVFAEICQAGISHEVDASTHIIAFATNALSEISKLLELFKEPPGIRKWFVINNKIDKVADKEYDFIIVGSGSAGSVIANRLSEVKKWKILLLETGLPETAVMGVPVFAPGFQFTPYNWKYLMEKENDNFRGLNEDRMHWPRGKALGGTSTINYMIYTRGNRWDYDRWAADGNPGWSYEEVLPYFIKSEKAQHLVQHDRRFHGEKGFLSVENIYRSELVDAFIEAGPDVGLNLFDYNANVSFGVSAIQANVKKGRRNSVATAFLMPVRNRQNLDIIVNAHVTKILIDTETKTAYGVSYEKNGRKYKAIARKEVILSAGAFHSPQLLMLSGIGPKKHLEKLGINVLQDLPVGRNLHDHLTFPGLSFEMDASLGLNLKEIIPTIGTFLNTGKGPLTSLGGVEGIGYIKTSLADYPEDYPDMELLFVGGTLASDLGLFTYRGMNIRSEVYDSLWSRTKIDYHAWTVFPMLLHPKSTGHMELRSTNPYDAPKFFGNFFTDPGNHDLRTFVESIRIIQKIANSTAFQRFGSKLNPRKMYGCDHLTFDSDEYWSCCIRAIGVTLHHQVGTAKMGPKDDPTAVVNADLQVHGIKNLRVADCSIIPRAMGAHTNAPSVMVGEKASDIIKLFWGELNT